MCSFIPHPYLKQIRCQATSNHGLLYLKDIGVHAQTLRYDSADISRETVQILAQHSPQETSEMSVESSSIVEEPDIGNER